MMHFDAMALRVPWKPSNTKPDPAEAEFLAWLDKQGVAYERETQLFVLRVVSTEATLERERTEGFAPDVVVQAREGEWGQQYIEFTASQRRGWLKYKVRRCNQTQVQHGVQVMLVVAGPARPTSPNVTVVYWDDIKDNPELFLGHLRPKTSATREAA